jgi:large subunit ribosomal protein L30
VALQPPSVSVVIEAGLVAQQVVALAAPATVVAVAVAGVMVAVAIIAAVVAADREVADVAEAKSKQQDTGGKSIKITLVRSIIGYPQNQRDAVRTLGLHRMNETVEHPDSPQLRGQIFKVKHLVQVEES